jgi:hypothetical protein
LLFRGLGHVPIEEGGAQVEGATEAGKAVFHQEADPGAELNPVEEEGEGDVEDEELDGKLKFRVEGEGGRGGGGGREECEVEG